MSASKYGIKKQTHAGFAIYKDSDGFFWVNGERSESFEGVEACKEEIDAFNSEDVANNPNHPANNPSEWVG